MKPSKTLGTTHRVQCNMITIALMNIQQKAVKIASSVFHSYHQTQFANSGQNEICVNSNRGFAQIQQKDFYTIHIQQPCITMHNL